MRINRNKRSPLKPILAHHAEFCFGSWDDYVKTDLRFNHNDGPRIVNVIFAYADLIGQKWVELLKNNQNFSISPPIYLLVLQTVDGFEIIVNTLDRKSRLPVRNSNTFNFLKSRPDTFANFAGALSIMVDTNNLKIPAEVLNEVLDRARQQLDHPHSALSDLATCEEPVVDVEETYYLNNAKYGRF